VSDWRRLSVRVVAVDLLRLVISAVPGYAGVVLLNDDGPVWPLVIASAVGALGALADFLRWVSSRYRVTGERVEMRSGLVVRRHRSVSRDRIRSVDSSARLLQRLMGVRVVHVGSGEPGTSFKLDALDRASAALLQRELRTVPAPAAADPDSATVSVVGETETVIARLRRPWIFYNALKLWAPLAVAGPLFGAYWFLRPFGVDLLDAARGLIDRGALGWFWTVVVGLAVAYPLGVVAVAISFAAENWRFELARTGTPPATALVTRRGLFSVRSVQRDDQRMRGLAFKEPLALRWLRLTETRVLTTGLGQTGGETPGATVLPRIPLADARALAPAILPDGSRPLQAPLHRHPRGALTRRLFAAVLAPAVAAGSLWVLARTGAIPAGWWWWLPMTALPLTLVLAVVAYRALGHAVSGPYLVVRSGALNRDTVALQSRAVIGWTVEQSLLQRRGHRMTVGIATAAGEQHYTVPDAGVDQALAFVSAATPELAARFLVPATPAAEPALPPASPIRS
jgi:putative membrane protein